MQTRNRRLLLALIAAATFATGAGLGAADVDVAQVLPAPPAGDKPFFAQRELTLSEHLE